MSPDRPEVFVVLTRDGHRLVIGWLAQLRAQWYARGKALTAVEEAALRALLYPGSDSVPTFDTAASGTASCWCTTLEASQRLKVSQRAVRKAIARGDLESRRGQSARGRHLISEQSIAAWASKRAARTARDHS